MQVNVGRSFVGGAAPSVSKVSSGLSLIYEEPVEPNSGVWFHKILPMVCVLDHKLLIKITNYECGKVLALFDLFAQGEQSLDPKIFQRKLFISNAMFVDKYAVVWSSGSTEVATNMISRLQHINVPDYLLLIDKHIVIRWDYIGQTWSYFEVTSDSKNTICRSVLYDESNIVLGFEDGTIKLFNFMGFTTTVTLKEGHKSPISFLSVFSRDLTSKPFIVSAETNHPTILCWNPESQSVAFKFMDTAKGIYFNRFYNYFLICSECNITLWNSFTGLKIASLQVHQNSQPVEITSMTPYHGHTHSLCQYLVATEKQVLMIDLLNCPLLESDTHSRMIKLSKLSTNNMANADIVIEGEPVPVGEKERLQFFYNPVGRHVRARSPAGFYVFEETNRFLTQITSHPLYFSRTPSVLIKEYITSQGHVKPVTIKDLKIIRKSETQEFVPSGEQTPEDASLPSSSNPKSVFLHALGNNITANIVDVFVDETGKLDYVAQSSILFTNEFRYCKAKIELSYNSRFFIVLEHSQSELQLFFIDNKNLVTPGEREPAAMLLHPLGSVNKLSQMPAYDFVWKSDALEFCAIIWLHKKNGQPALESSQLSRKGDYRPVIGFFAIKPDGSAMIPLRTLDLDDTPQLGYLSTYLAFFNGKPPKRFSLKQGLEDVHTEPLSELPLKVFQSTNASVVYCVYSKSVELIRTFFDGKGQAMFNTETQLPILRGVETCYLWDDLLFLSDLDSIYMCFPAIFGKPPMKIKLATMLPQTTHEHLKPAGTCYFLGIIDQKLLVVNPSLEFTPINLTDTYLTYYFKLKAGNTKSAYEETKDLPNHEQEIVVRIALYFRFFRLALLYRSFCVVYLQEFPQILQLVVAESHEVQQEYILVLLRAATQTTADKRVRIYREVLSHAEVLQQNPRLQEVLAELSSG